MECNNFQNFILEILYMGEKKREIMREIKLRLLTLGMYFYDDNNNYN